MPAVRGTQLLISSCLLELPHLPPAMQVHQGGREGRRGLSMGMMTLCCPWLSSAWPTSNLLLGGTGRPFDVPPSGSERALTGRVPGEWRYNKHLPPGQPLSCWRRG